MKLQLELEYKSHIPLYRRLSDALRKAILDGRLKPGQSLPSVRELANSLSISRATVLAGLEDLVGQGYIQCTPGSGTEA